MANITTEAWVLHRGSDAEPSRGELSREPFSFPALADDEVLVEPLYGCWEANMSHALQRRPIDICKLRGEKKVVVGNAGVLRVLRPGSAVHHLKEGDICLLYADAIRDPFGYVLKVLGYDAPNTMGVLAKRAKVPSQCLIPIPADSPLTLPEWAATSVRYITAWDNWRVAYGCWRVQMPHVDPAECHVWAWGGGVSLIELYLARRAGFKTAMIASQAGRLQLIADYGITPIDRRGFQDLYYDEAKMKRDPDYRARFLAAERRFLDIVADLTRGNGASIFIENIGLPVFRSTLKALARQGVIATSGWKHGMMLPIRRAVESMNRHVHVHTHGSLDAEAHKAVASAAEIGLRIPLQGAKIYGWDEIPELARAYEADRIESYFPVFEVNAP